jgi:hypothetical protein
MYICMYMYMYTYINIYVYVYFEGFEGGEEGEGATYIPSGNQTLLKNAIYMRRDPTIQVRSYSYILIYVHICMYIYVYSEYKSHDIEIWDLYT